MIKNKNRIIELALQAGAEKFSPDRPSNITDNYLVGAEFLQRFAALVQAEKAEKIDESTNIVSEQIISKDRIREVFMAHGFEIKEGHSDLKPYVYDAVYALFGYETPKHVGDSKFESWFSEYNTSGKGSKQQMRDAYAAGMGDPVAYVSNSGYRSSACMKSLDEYKRMEGWEKKYFQPVFTAPNLQTPAPESEKPVVCEPAKTPTQQKSSQMVAPGGGHIPPVPLAGYNPSPDEINRQHGAHYRCRPCGATSGLHWYRGTSCPVCSNPECTKALNEEWSQMEQDMQRGNDDD